jgi:hypothetical protein
LGQLVAQQQLDPQAAEDALTDAALSIGLTPTETRLTIRSGIHSGYKKPRAPINTLNDTHPTTFTSSPTSSHPHLPTPDTEEEENKTPPHTTWWAEPLTLLAEQALDAPHATLFTRTDTKAAFYPGCVNSIFGESGSGKTWAAIYCCKQQIEQQQPVLYLDFEDNHTTLIKRLTLLGTPTSALGLVLYANPDQALDLVARTELNARIPGNALIIVDGVNSAMTLLGLDINNNNDATFFYHLLLRPLTKHGAAVLAIDHIPKSYESRTKGAIGAQAKRAMISGSSLAVDVKTPIAPGMVGRLTLTIDKDRHGDTMSVTNNGKNYGTLIIDATDTTYQTWIEPPTHHQSDPSRVLMEQISQLLENTSQPLGINTIYGNVAAQKFKVKQSLTTLLQLGYIAIENRGQKLLHSSLKPFRAAIQETILG